MFNKTIENDKLNNIKKMVSRALAWNTFESFYYQALFLGHQTTLFCTIDKKIYGMYGALFAFLFFSINVLNGSLDQTIIPLFTSITAHRKNFKNFIFSYLATQTLFMWYASFSFGVLFLYVIPTPKVLEPFMTLPWIALLSTFIASEGTKKNIRALLHLAFKNKTTAFIEVSDITLYVTSVWFLYFLGFPLSIGVLVVPFICVSLFATTVLMWQLSDYYKTLPIQHENDLDFPHKSFWYNRIFLYGNQLSCSFFSGNFLLPFFASYCGFAQAGIAAFINTTAFTLTAFIRRIFAPSAAALFANTKKLSHYTKQSAFSFFSRKYLYVIFSILTVFLLNGRHLLYLKIGEQSLQTWTLVYVFFLIHFLDNMFILYDKLFAAEEKSHYTLLCNVSSFFSCALVAFFLLPHSPLLALGFCIFFRFCAFFILMIFGKKIWNISLEWKNITPKLVVPILLSFLLFFYKTTILNYLASTLTFFFKIKTF